ncbi:MAG: TerB family tellurite resistance protein [Gammaproteobacteria bacterium]|nr:TerB family tellurite resistance protein [Gammaproteobacteria bacterium]
MHIVLGMLGSIVTALWLLHRLAEMGIDLGGLNPWLWHRRRKWRKTYEANPIFSISSPMEATALLISATAKADGEMSAEEKSAILEIFESEFHLSKRDAAGLLISSIHLLGRGDEVRDQLDAVLAPSANSFSPEQTDSALTLMSRIADVAGPASELQTALIEATRSRLERSTRAPGKWH